MSKVAHYSIATEDVERAEALLLGSMFLHPEMVTAIRVMFRPEDFTLDRHRLIYETLLIVDDIAELDMVQVISILLTQDELERVGDVLYLTRLKRQAERMTMSVEEQARQLKLVILNRLLIQTKETLLTSTGQDKGDYLKNVIGDLEHAISITQQLLTLKYELPASTPPFRTMQEKPSSSVSSSSAQPLRQIPRLRDIMEQAKRKQLEREKPKTTSKSHSQSRALPQGYVFGDEEVDVENEPDGATADFEDQGEQM